MSANRRHATAPELGFADLIGAVESTPSGVFRAQGRVSTRGFPVKRFNRAVRLVRVGRTTMVVARVRFNQKLGLWIDTGESMRLRWDRLDWISFKASGDPNGTWMKVTVTGRSDFGAYSIDERDNVIHIDGRMWSYGNRADAVAMVVNILSA